MTPDYSDCECNACRAPCSFCTSLDVDEVEIWLSGGRQALMAFQDSKGEAEEVVSPSPQPETSYRSLSFLAHVDNWRNDHLLRSGLVAIAALEPETPHD